MSLLRRHWASLLILAAAMVALAPALRPGQAIGPWDDLRAMMAGEPTPRAFDVLQMDAVLQFYGWRDLVFESWGRFEPPFWNPFQLMGTPLLANSQSGAFYPLHILVGVLQVPTWLGILLLALFHLYVGGSGVRALVLRMGGSEVGAAIGGALFAVSPFMLSWVGLASVVTTCAWIPWALVFAHGLFDRGRPVFREGSLLALSIAMMVLGGHLQFAAYGFMAVVVLVSAQAIVSKRWAGLALAGLGCVLGAGLAAPQLLPVLEYSKSSHRQNTPTEAGYAFYQRGAVTPVEAAGLVFPDALGTPGRAVDPSAELKLTSYWPAYTKIGGNYAESALYLGPAAVLLLAFAAFRRGWRASVSVSAVGALGLAMAMGTPINKLLYFGLPGWSSTGSPGRAAVLFVLAACAVAGWAWPRDGERAEFKKPVYALFGVVAAFLVVVASRSGALETWNPGLKPVAEDALSGNLRFLWPIAVASLALTLGAVHLASRGRGKLAAASLVLATIIIAGPRLVPAGMPLERGTPDPNTRHAFVNADWQLLVGLPVVNPPNTAAIERKLDVGGYDSLLDRETFAILNEINGRDSAPEANGNMALIKPGFDRQKIAAAGVTRIEARLSDGTVDSEFPVSNNGGRAVLLQDTGGRVDIRSDSTTSTVVHTVGPGTLVLRDRNMPGWTAGIEGKAVPITGDQWREVQIGPGEQTVVFSYTPPGLWRGLAFGGISALLLLAGLVAGRPKKPR